MGRASDTRSIGTWDLEKDEEIERLKKEIDQLKKQLRATLMYGVAPAKGRPQ